MANQWLRLWHDMPTDPKWRTIAKASGQRIGDVMAVYVHMLVIASNATERGRTQSFNCEDVASALDIETEQVAAIVDAMQGRVIDGDRLKGWEKRQVAREDGSAERAKAWREEQKAKKIEAPNAAERKRTPDKDKDKEESKDSPGFAEFWQEYPNHSAKASAMKAWGKIPAELHPAIMAAVFVQRISAAWTKDNGQFVPHAATWLNGKRWEDQQPANAANTNLFAGAL